MKTGKKIKMIIAVIVAIVSLAALVGLFYNATSTAFVLKKTPGVRWVLKQSLEIERDLAESQRLDSLIVVQNVQIDSLARIEQRSDADKILQSNYELIKNDYERQKNHIDFAVMIEFSLVMFMLFLVYLGLCIFAIVYIVSNIQKRKKN